MGGGVGGVWPGVGAQRHALASELPAAGPGAETNRQDLIINAEPRPLFKRAHAFGPGADDGRALFKRGTISASAVAKKYNITFKLRARHVPCPEIPDAKRVRVRPGPDEHGDKQKRTNVRRKGERER